MVSNTIWSKAQDNTGACNNCGNLKYNPLKQNVEAWSCGTTDISLDLSKSTDAQSCVSFSTRDTCKWKQKDMKTLEVSLKSKGCGTLWAAPLWMVSDRWAYPQSKTGEIDIFERGCHKSSGYLLSYGSDPRFVKNDVYDEGSNNNAETNLTAFFEFDQGADEIKTWKCPFGSDPSGKGPRAAKCVLKDTEHGYFSRTSSADRMDNGNRYLHFVSDIWNGCDKLDCGDVKTRTSCFFNVSNIKMSFHGNKNGFYGKPTICNQLLTNYNGVRDDDKYRLPTIPVLPLKPDLKTISSLQPSLQPLLPTLPCFK